VFICVNLRFILLPEIMRIRAGEISGLVQRLGVARAVSPTNAATSTTFAAATMVEASAKLLVKEEATVRPRPNCRARALC